MNDFIFAFDLGRYKSVACISSRPLRKCLAKATGHQLVALEAGEGPAEVVVPPA